MPVLAPAPIPTALNPSVNLELVNKELTRNITELVSNTIDTASKIHGLEMENEKLREQLQISREETDLLRDMVKRVEEREQASKTLLNISEGDQKALKELNVKLVQGIQRLRQRYGEMDATRVKAENERDTMANRTATLEVQLAGTQAQLVSTQTQLANARGQLVARLQPLKPITAEASAQTEPLRSETEVSS